MRPITILLAEDSPEDVELVREAFDYHRFAADLHAVRDGVEAMAFLRREGEHAEAPAPDLLLLDLNMPRKDGRETLAEIKADPDLHTLPVVILTTSTAEVDIVESYTRHASAFLTKPVDFDAFLELIRQLGEFWLTAVRYPPRTA
ncbi:response regulator [Thiohalospira sp.]|uniref:response regulator n=1 Tax=Thiohalospira sp. TaxID=3080549 RepID=UPI0039814DEA